MFAAHLVFGDINDHSSLPFIARAGQVEKFQSICDAARPRKLAKSRHSFYDVDNDSLMAGFSSVSGMIDGMEVLLWTLDLESRLHEAEIPTSFGLNLLACNSAVDWSVCDGIFNDPRRLYLPDEVFAARGHVLRPKLVGDALIIASRLLELAKRTKCQVVFAVFQGGHLSPTWVSKLKRVRRGIEVDDISHQFGMLGAKKESWLAEHSVKAFGVRRTLRAA